MTAPSATLPIPASELQLAVDDHGSIDEAAKFFDLKRKPFREMCRVAGVSVGAGVKDYHLPPVFDIPNLDVPIRHNVETDGSIAVTADWHLPLTRFDLVNPFLDRAVDLGVRHLAIVGDWFNMDSISDYDSKQESANLVRELELSTQTMERVGKCFDRIYFTWGNHDARFHKALAYKVAFKKAMRLLFEDLAPEVVDKIVFTNLDHMWVDTPRGPWYLCHPKTYSSVPLTQARRIASKVLAHVGTAHSHHSAVGHDVSGQFVCVELGGFHDRARTTYLQRSTAFPNWNNGHAFIRSDGSLVVEGEGWSVGP